MRNKHLMPLPSLALLSVAGLLSACGGGGGGGGAATSFTDDGNVLLVGGTQLSRISTQSLGAIGTPVTLTGIVAGDALVAIDRRPQNGMLYGLGVNTTTDTVQLYLISAATGVCTPVGTAGGFVDADGTTTTQIVGPQFDIDFNPTVDRIRVVGASNENFRMNPNTGGLVDGNLNSGTPGGTNMDGLINGAFAGLHGAAYTNNSINQTVTTLYTFDQSVDRFFIQNPPNAGTQTLGTDLSSTIIHIRGFDIPRGVNVGANNAAATGQGIIATRIAGDTFDSLARFDLASGQITGAGSFGGAAILSMALQEANDPTVIALDATGGNLLRFLVGTPGTTTTVGVTGITAGETLVGLDLRPQTGQYYALGVSATADTATLYLLDPQTGAATAVGTPGQIAFVDAAAASVDLPDPATTGYGFDFNPTVDRIRVVCGSGLNFRLNPITGAPVDGNLNSGTPAGTNPDGPISGGTTGATGAAYTNSFGQSLTGGVTTLYVLDPTGNGLHILSAPNAGTATAVIPVTLDGVALDFTGVSGFDIGDEVRVLTSNTAATGSGYAALTVGGVTGLYRIDLPTGAATHLGSIGAGATGLSGLTVGHRTVN